MNPRMNGHGPVDKCGKELRAGQIVDMCLTGMVSGYIMEVVEPRIEVPGMKSSPPFVGIQIGIRLPIVEGSCEQLYVIAEPVNRAQENERNRSRLTAIPGNEPSPPIPPTTITSE